MATLKALICEGEYRLSGHPAARLEAELLLALAADVSRAYLFAHPEQEIERNRVEDFAALVARRANGEPMAYILGEREFWSIPLRVTPAVLIPRPETEVLVEAALARIPREAELRIADLGTGSGAIAIALASERPRCAVYATEISAEALQVAKDNASRLKLGNISFRQGSWFEPLSGIFDLIVSNPPYVATGDPHLDEGDLRFEPGEALESGPDGLEAIEAIVASAPRYLAAGGWLLTEHGMDQGAECRALLETNGFASIETLRDLEGSERVSLGALPGAPAR
jgi:release factor glutamine methyltransferase